MVDYTGAIPLCGKGSNSLQVQWLPTCSYALWSQCAIKEKSKNSKRSHIIGSLIYLSSATRPDISFAMSKLSRFMSNLGDNHWRALQRVMCYIEGTMSFGIHYTGYPRVVEGYCDANWISDTDEIYATSGYVFSLGGGAVSWKSCEQTILTRSTIEAELTTLDH